MLLYPGYEECEVEFFDADGQTLAVLTVRNEDLSRVVAPPERAG